MTVKMGKNVNVGDNVIIERSPNQRSGCVGFTCGAFDLLHAGHALMLQEAKAQCDFLVVAVQSDPSLDRTEKNTPVQSYDERITMVSSIKFVDEVILYDTEEDLFNLLKELKPNIRIVGADWEGKKFTGSDLSIPIYFNSRNHGWSTSDLRRRVYEAECAAMLDITSVCKEKA